MPDTLISYASGVTGQTIRAILFSGATAWNPTADGGAGAFDTLTSGNWSQHLLTLTDPQNLGIYTIDLSTLSPTLPAGPVVGRVYAGTTPGAAPAASTGTQYWTGTQFAMIGTGSADSPGAVAAQDAVASNLDARVSACATVGGVWSATSRTVTGSTSPLPTTTGGIGPYALNHDGGNGSAGASDTIGGVPSAPDCLRVIDTMGNGISGATLRLYAAADATLSTVLGAATTGPDGRWLAPIYCASGSYQLVTTATGDQSQILIIVVP